MPRSPSRGESSASRRRGEETARTARAGDPRPLRRLPVVVRPGRAAWSSRRSPPRPSTEARSRRSCGEEQAHPRSRRRRLRREIVTAARLGLRLGRRGRRVEVLGDARPRPRPPPLRLRGDREQTLWYRRRRARPARVEVVVERTSIRRPLEERTSRPPRDGFARERRRASRSPTTTRPTPSAARFEARPPRTRANVSIATAASARSAFRRRFAATHTFAPRRAARAPPRVRAVDAAVGEHGTRCVSRYARPDASPTSRRCSTAG